MKGEKTDRAEYPQCKSKQVQTIRAESKKHILKIREKKWIRAYLKGRSRYERDKI
jgi:hypothetical protein